MITHTKAHWNKRIWKNMGTVLLTSLPLVPQSMTAAGTRTKKRRECVRF